MEPRSVDGHVPQFVQGVAGRPHRLPAAARRGNGRRNEGVRSTLHRQRHPRLPALRTRGGTHPQSRILLPWRHRGLRPPARGARPLPVGFRADPAQLRRLAPRQGGQHAQHRRRIPLRRTEPPRHSGRHHGTAAGRAPVERTRPHRRQTPPAPPRAERRFVGLPLRGIVSRRADRAERHDLHGALAGQPAHLLAARRADRCRPRISRRDGAGAAALSDHSVQRLQVLHALPLRARHPGHFAPLQQVHQRRTDALVVARQRLPAGTARLSGGVRPFGAAPSAATNACRTVRRTSTFPRRCSESTASSRTSNRTGNSDGLWNTGHWDERGSA